MLAFFRRRIWLIVGGMIFCLALSPSLMLLSPFIAPFVGNCPNLEAEGYLKLPPGAKEVNYVTRSTSRSCTTFLRFQLAPQELDVFVASTFIKQPLTSTLPTIIGGINNLEEATGWKVINIRSFLAGDGRGEHHQNLDEQFVFVDSTNQNLYTVYIVTKKNWL